LHSAHLSAHTHSSHSSHTRHRTHRTRTQIIPGHDFKPQIAQLVAYNLQDIEVMEAWEGPARLHLIPHVNAPAADLPVRKIVGGKHIRANLTLPHGFVLHDYIAERKKSESNFYMSGNPLAEKAKATEKAKAKAEVAPQDDKARLTREKVLNLPSMPAICPSYPGTSPARACAACAVCAVARVRCVRCELSHVACALVQRRLRT
jgi:hypothetical protein